MWAVRPERVHQRERVFVPLPFHHLQRSSSIGSDPFEDSRGRRRKGSRPKADHATSHEVPSATAFKAAPAAARIFATRSAICGFLLATLESRQTAVISAHGCTPTSTTYSATA